MRTRPTLHLTVGLPGVGKTTLARRIAADQVIVRLTPDEWMAPLFGESEADGRRDILEGRMIWVASRVLSSGSSVILDFGCWSPEERYALRSVADLADADFRMHYLELDERERRVRATDRWGTEAGTTFAMSDADHDLFLRSFRPPTRAELTYEPAPDPPAGFGSWLRWASHRWPTLPPLDEAAFP
jgi:predicted kinase